MEPDDPIPRGLNMLQHRRAGRFWLTTQHRSKNRRVAAGG